ncbi:MAG: hypothetical protein KC620_01125 [Myxococcales bacterium]|nr:hypothetical protein [Myxococcales bacterium]
MRWLALLALATLGCGELDPEIGPQRAQVPPFEAGIPVGVAGDAGPGEQVPCDIEDSDPYTPVSYITVRDRLFRPRCSCHTTPAGIGRLLGGLDLDNREAVLEGGATGGPDDVVPGNPCASIIMAKTSDSPPFGLRMPRGKPPLTGAERQLLSDWIVEGAPP